MSPNNFDQDADMIQAFGFSNPGRRQVISVTLQYLKPTVNPPVFQPFLNPQAELYSSMRISNMSHFVTEEDSQQAVKR